MDPSLKARCAARAVPVQPRIGLGGWGVGWGRACLPMPTGAPRPPPPPRRSRRCWRSAGGRWGPSCAWAVLCGCRCGGGGAGAGWGGGVHGRSPWTALWPPLCDAHRGAALPPPPPAHAPRSPPHPPPRWGRAWRRRSRRTLPRKWRRRYGGRPERAPAPHLAGAPAFQPRSVRPPARATPVLAVASKSSLEFRSRTRRSICRAQGWLLQAAPGKAGLRWGEGGTSHPHRLGCPHASPPPSPPPGTNTHSPTAGSLLPRPASPNPQL